MNSYTASTNAMNEADWDRSKEELTILSIYTTSSNQLNITVQNTGTVSSTIIWLGLFNQSVTPEAQWFFSISRQIEVGQTQSILSPFTVSPGSQYTIQLVTKAGNVFNYVLLPASQANLVLTLVAASPTVYQGNNITMFLTVTNNNANNNAVQNITVSLAATPSNLTSVLVSPDSSTISSLGAGQSAFFRWTYAANYTGTVVFNATYDQAPSGAFATATVTILAAPSANQAEVTVTGTNASVVYNPTQWNTLGGTSNVSGTISSLTLNDSNSAVFNSFYTGNLVDINHFVNSNASNVDGSSSTGTHSNFTAMQSGPDSITDTLTETAQSAFEYGQAFKSSSVTVSTSSGTAVDDSEAVLNINLDKNSTLFTIYNAGSDYNSGENRYGKGCAINVDGVDVAFSWQAPTCVNDADSVTVVYAANMTAGSHVIKGRFFANAGAGNTVYIDARQIVAFWFPSVVASFVRSTTTSTTTSSSPVDDPQASSTFTLDNSSIAFILYNAGNKQGSTEPISGKGVTIKVDGTDISTKEWQSAVEANTANSATIAYVGSLAAGSHTIKGRYFSNSGGSTTTINERQLMVFCFPASSITYGFVQSTTPVTTTSTSFVDDAQAVLTPTLTGNSDSLLMYIGGNPYGATEHWEGKGVRLQIDGTSMSNSSSWQSPYEDNYADSATSLWSQQLASGTHTIKGKFSVNNGGYGETVTVSHRQLLMIAFSRMSYQLDLEAQWSNVDYHETNEELCINVKQSGSNTYSLDASGGYMLIGSGAPNWGSSSGTISFWIKWDVVGGKAWGQHTNMETRFSGSNLVLDWGGTSSLTSTTSFSADKWYFIAIAWNEGTDKLTLYVGDQNNAPTIDSQNTGWYSAVSTVGVTQNNFLASRDGSEPTDGKGEELRYWNAERSLSALQSDYKAELTGSEANLRSYFKLNNNFDDIGPNNNDGSSSGSCSFSSDVPFGGLPEESILVDVWNGSAWQNVLSNLSTGWNNVSVSSYLTSSNFTIRFRDTQPTDAIQDSWDIDAALLHLWSATDQYSAQVEFTGSSNTYDWSSFLWNVAGYFSTGSVSVTIQFYNFTQGAYMTSGNGYVTYTSSSVANTSQLQSVNVISGVGDFTDSSGYWKVKITATKNTSSQFRMSADWIEIDTSYVSAGNSVPYNSWQSYVISSTSADGVPTPYVFMSIYSNGTNISFRNGFDNSSIPNPAWVQLDVNGEYQLKIKASNDSSQTFVLFAVVGTTVGQKSIFQEAP